MCCTHMVENYTKEGTHKQAVCYTLEAKHKQEACCDDFLQPLEKH